MGISTDIMVTVDRSVRPPYPSFVKRVIAPELESTGPAQYDVAMGLTVLSCAVAPGLKILTAEMVSKLLIREKYLPACLGIHDGIAIQAKGIEGFRAVKRVLELDEIHLWRSIVADGARPEPGMLFGQSECYLPTLVERNKAVEIEWRKFIDCKWFKDMDIVYFTSLLPKSMV